MKAKVKSFEEIKQTLDWSGCSIFTGIDFAPDMIGLCGKEVDVTPDASDGVYKTSDGWFFDEDWLELSKEAKEVENFKSDPSTITITVRADDREFAHKCLDDAIDEYEKKREWTPAEIERAKDKTCSLLMKAYKKGLCPVFYNLEDLKDPFVRCDLNYGTFGIDKITYAFPKGKDKFNWDIGRCVALCKAMGEPVPDFIKNKNKN